MTTVGQPIEMGLGGPNGSITWSPCRAAGRLSIMTVVEAWSTTPGPWGGTGEGVVQAWMSAPEPVIMLDMEAKVLAFKVCSAA
jgi:hypothetical protein